jgi:hypothetical protein
MNQTAPQRNTTLSTDALIAALQAADTVPELFAALANVRLNYNKLRAAIQRINSLPDRDAANQYAEVALIDAGVPPEALAAWADATVRLRDRQAETPEQRTLRKARADALRLVDELGEDDPEAMLAIIRFVNLTDPGACERMAAECGIKLPTPSSCNAIGEPLYSSQDLAVALGLPYAEMVAAIQALPDEDRGIRISAHTLH